MSEEMPDQFEDRVREIVKEELAAYERELLEWHTLRQVRGISEQTVAYEKFIDNVLLGGKDE